MSEPPISTLKGCKVKAHNGVGYYPLVIHTPSGQRVVAISLTPGLATPDVKDHLAGLLARECLAPSRDFLEPYQKAVGLLSSLAGAIQWGDGIAVREALVAAIIFLDKHEKELHHYCEEGGETQGIEYP
jgi:hypothetical protein